MTFNLIVIPCRLIDRWLASIHEDQLLFLLPRNNSVGKMLFYVLGLLEKGKMQCQLGADITSNTGILTICTICISNIERLCFSLKTIKCCLWVKAGILCISVQINTFVMRNEQNKFSFCLPYRKRQQEKFSVRI